MKLFLMLFPIATTFALVAMEGPEGEQEREQQAEFSIYRKIERNVNQMAFVTILTNNYTLDSITAYTRFLIHDSGQVPLTIEPQKDERHFFGPIGNKEVMEKVFDKARERFYDERPKSLAQATNIDCLFYFDHTDLPAEKEKSWCAIQ